MQTYRIEDAKSGRFLMTIDAPDALTAGQDAARRLGVGEFDIRVR